MRSLPVHNDAKVEKSCEVELRSNWYSELVEVNSSVTLKAKIEYMILGKWLRVKLRNDFLFSEFQMVLYERESFFAFEKLKKNQVPISPLSIYSLTLEEVRVTH